MNQSFTKTNPFESDSSGSIMYMIIVIVIIVAGIGESDIIFIKRKEDNLYGNISCISL